MSQETDAQRPIGKIVRFDFADLLLDVLERRASDLHITVRLARRWSACAGA